MSAGLSEIRGRHPAFLKAVVADARVAVARRGERGPLRPGRDTVIEIFRLALVSDAFLAQACYRAKAACQARRIPVLPRLLHRLAIVWGQISIGDPVVVEAGVYLPHGQVVVDGITSIAHGVEIGPFVTIGLVAGTLGGPTIEKHARIGTNASVIGPIRVGAHAQVGAGAVVTHDVEPRTIVVGVPARPSRD